MDHRTHESAMEWEYEDKRGPMDPKSPYTSLVQNNGRSCILSSSSPNKSRPAAAAPFGAKPPTNPFAFASTSGHKLHPEKGSIFDRDFQNQHKANPFSNPSFTTPRKPFDEISVSDMSGVGSGPVPADADVFEMPMDSPDVDRDSRNVLVSPMRGSGSTAIMHGKSPSLPARVHAPGKGEIPRGKFGRLDKVRKRRRHNEDRDVVTLRRRMESDASDSNDMDVTDVAARAVPSRRSGRRNARQGWLGGVLSAVTANPTAPEVLFQWLRLVLQGVVIGMILYFMWQIVSSIKHDMDLATERARLERAGNITQCEKEYMANECHKRRLPRLAEDCNAWDICRNQDPNDIQTIHVGVRQFAELLNQLVSALHYKTLGFIGGLIFLAVFASRSSGRNTMPPPAQHGDSSSKTPLGGHTFAVPQADMNQAFILAPIQTPRKLVSQGVLEEGREMGTQTPAYKSIMTRPETPSGRRSPNKEKGTRTPSQDLQ